MTLWTASSMFCGIFNVGPSFLSRSGAYVHVYYAFVRLLGSWIGFPMSISLSGEPASGGIAQLFRPGLVSELLAHVFVPGNGSDIAQVKRLNCLPSCFLDLLFPGIRAEKEALCLHCTARHPMPVVGQVNVTLSRRSTSLCVFS